MGNRSDCERVQACLLVGRGSRIQANSNCWFSVISSTARPLGRLNPVFIESFDSIHNVHLLIICQFRIDRQGEDFFRSLLRDWKISTAVLQERITLLQMERERIVDIGPNSFLIQELSQLFSLWNPDDILVEDVTVLVLCCRQAAGQGRRRGYLETATDITRPSSAVPVSTAPGV